MRHPMPHAARARSGTFPATLPVVALALSLAAWGGSTVPHSSARAVGEVPDQGALEPTPAALLGNRAVSWDDLRPALSEAAGAVVLGELVLDAELDARTRAAGLTIDDAAIERERALLLQSMTERSGSADEAARAVAALRAQRGLGPVRFTALLRRTAMLRALVAPTVAVTPELVEEAFAVRHGEQVVLRLIVTPTSHEAAAALAEVRAARAGATSPVNGGESKDGASRAMATIDAMDFARVAARRSTDASRAAGGLLEPMSVEDSRYPAALRAAVRSLKAGEVAGPIALGGSGARGGADRGSGGSSFGIVYVEERRPADGATLDSVREGLERELRIGLERAAMERLAAEITRAAPVSVMDRSLGWSWERREGGGEGGGRGDAGR